MWNRLSGGRQFRKPETPKRTNTGIAVVIFPGGGYNELAIDLEGMEVCDWLTSKGIMGVLLKYRVPGTKRYTDSRYRKSGAVSEITNGVGRCAEDGGTAALSRRGVACRSAQGRSAFGASNEHAF